MHEYGNIHSNEGTYFHLENYFNKPLKVNNGEKYIFNDDIKKDIIECINDNEIPATFENATKMIKYIKNNINPNEVIKVLVSVNIDHPEYIKNYIDTVEYEYGELVFDKRDYFSIFEEELLARRTPKV